MTEEKTEKKINKTGQALSALMDAVRTGFSDWKLISRDSDLNNIRENPIFRKLVKNQSALYKEM